MAFPTERAARAAIEALRDDMARVRFALPSPTSAAGAERAGRLIERLDDAVLPRLRLTLPPQIVVLFGATGCGKSVIANTLTRSASVEVGP
ncbi:MAG: hypothetical protein LBK72_07640, partial [Bifidobacteriaceae bacterium]|nr:hypothetical protein [Bifidobacteriaceae bacterium]